MDLIQLTHKYFIEIEEYEKLNIGEVLPNQRDLAKKICYPKIENWTGTETRFLDEVKKLIKFDNISGNRIKIIYITPTNDIEKASNNFKENVKRIITKYNRNYLLDYVIYFQKEYDDILYITATEIVRESGIFNKFYYEYSDLRYDNYTATEEERNKKNDFALSHNIDKDYLVDIMDRLNEIVYKIFKRDNIFSWTKERALTAERVLYQNYTELDERETRHIEEKYYSPYKDNPAKSRTKLANQKYIKENNLSAKEHNWFYYIYKFTKNDIFLNKVKYVDLIHHQMELNKKIIELLEKSINSKSDYHKKYNNDFKYIIENIRL